MLVEDKIVLEQTVKEYPIQDVIDALHQVVSEQADELSDQMLMGPSKEMSVVAWHLQSIGSKDEDLSIE